MYETAAGLKFSFTSKPVKIQKVKIGINRIETKQIKSVLENQTGKIFLIDFIGVKKKT